MARLPVKWTPNARLQKRAIFQYWTAQNRSKVFAKKLNSEIKEHLTFLCSNPSTCKTSLTGQKYIRVRSYFIFVHIQDTIIITSLVDARQNPSKLFDQIES